MYIENISPVLFSIGPFVVRLYGVMAALSFLIGLYYLRKHGEKQGLDDDFVFNLFIIALFSVVIGARAVYILANWSYFAQHPELIIRVDRGGLAFHGGLLGGMLSTWLYCYFKKVNWRTLLDLVVPGICTGIMLIRIANIFNQEILGRPAPLLGLERHPAQVYGFLVGLIMLIVHNLLARKKERPPGDLFWNFVLGYTILRGFFEETFREMPLILLGYIHPGYGFGFFTAVQVFTPFILLLALFMLSRIKKTATAAAGKKKQRRKG